MHAYDFVQGLPQPTHTLGRNAHPTLAAMLHLMPHYLTATDAQGWDTVSCLLTDIRPANLHERLAAVVGPIVANDVLIVVHDGAHETFTERLTQSREVRAAHLPTNLLAMLSMAYNMIRIADAHTVIAIFETLADLIDPQTLDTLSDSQRRQLRCYPLVDIATFVADNVFQRIVGTPTLHDLIGSHAYADYSDARKRALHTPKT